MNLHKLYIPALVIVAALGVYAARNWWLDHEARIRAEEQDKASKQVIAKADQSMADRDKKYEQDRQNLLNQIADIKTSKQAVTVLQPIIQPGGQGTTPPEVKKSDLSPAAQQNVPGSPDTHFTLFTDDQMIALGKREKTCELTETGFTKCQADLADMKTKFDASQKDLAAAQQAAKGGNWMRRTLRVAVPIGCAAGGAWLASKASKDAKGPAVGALVGGTGCALSFHF